MKSIFYYETKLGKIGIAEDGKGITDLYLANKLSSEDMNIYETPLIKETAKQLQEYLLGERLEFDVPLSIKGTEFQKQVWKELKNIPYGKTYSYKEIAQKIGKPTAARAVGMANNKNPILIIIPCHRVIGVDGNLIGYAAGLDIKKQLLDMENNN